MAQEIRLSLETTSRSQQLADLTLDLVADLRRHTGLEVRQMTRPAEAGERPAEVGLLGQIVLTFLSAGAATALIGCLKTYIERDRTLRVWLRRADGTELELEGRHFDPKVVDETLRALQRLASS